MTPEEKVLKREDCEKLDVLLKKLGIKMETERVWVLNIFGKNEWYLSYRERYKDSIFDYIPAPDIEELLKIMPKEIKLDERLLYFSIDITSEGYSVYCHKYAEFVFITQLFNSTSLVQPLFKMLCWLDEKGLIK